MILHAFCLVLVFEKLQKATVNYTLPAHLFAKNLAASTLVLIKIYIKSARKMQVWLKLKDVCVCIQGVPAGMCNTSGECSLC